MAGYRPLPDLTWSMEVGLEYWPSSTVPHPPGPELAIVEEECERRDEVAVTRSSDLRRSGTRVEMAGRCCCLVCCPPAEVVHPGGHPRRVPAGGDVGSGDHHILY